MIAREPEFQLSLIYLLVSMDVDRFSLLRIPSYIDKYSNPTYGSFLRSSGSTTGNTIDVVEHK